MNKNKKKVIVRDVYGMRWFVKPKTQEVEPTHWKLRSALYAIRSELARIQKQLYGGRA